MKLGGGGKAVEGIGQSEKRLPRENHHNVHFRPPFSHFSDNLCEAVDGE